MLNELHKLSTTLSATNIKLKQWDEEYKSLPSGDCYRIWIGKDGSVTGIERLDKVIAAVCRKYGNNQQAFPAFNIAALFRISSDEHVAYFDDLLKGKLTIDADKLRTICVDDNWNDKLLKKVSGCLHKNIPYMQAGTAISALMQITEGLDGSSLRKAIETCVLSKLITGEDIKTYLPVLIYKGKKNKDASEDTGSLSIILDLSDWGQYKYPIANENTTEQINECLVKKIIDDTVNPCEDTNRNDAFNSPYGDVGKPMPTVRLISGFEVVLRSMFREQRCQFRYGKADDDSYPITKTNRADAKKALEFIINPDNEYIMWQKISGNAILFVYPDKLPLIPPRFTELFSGGQSNPQSRFETVAKQFISTLNGLPPKQRPNNIQLFALQQILPALSKRAKVIFTRNLSAQALINAAEEWQSGCTNLPQITFTELVIPFPLHVSGIVNNMWRQNGELANQGKTAVKHMQYYQGIDLLLDIPNKSKLLHYLHGLITHSSGLIMFSGNLLPRGIITGKHKQEIGKLFPLIGLFLYKCGEKKEDYMENTAFLIGQVLKISDELHELYCKIKRDGDIPPQLVGNSVFVSASETPIQALAQLGSRMCPYIAWAKQYRTQSDEKSGLAGWYLRQYEEVMTKLHTQLTEPIRFNDLEKAQLFIGYLAEISKDSNIEKTENKQTGGKQ